LLDSALIVNKPDVPLSQVVAVCPSCGLLCVEGPHGTSEQCIRALEAEMQRLSALLLRVKKLEKNKS